MNGNLDSLSCTNVKSLSLRSARLTTTKTCYSVRPVVTDEVTKRVLEIRSANGLLRVRMMRGQRYRALSSPWNGKPFVKSDKPRDRRHRMEKATGMNTVNTLSTWIPQCQLLVIATLELKISETPSPCTRCIKESSIG